MTLVNSLVYEAGSVSSKFRNYIVNIEPNQDIGRPWNKGRNFEALIKFASMIASKANWGLDEIKETCDAKVKLDVATDATKKSFHATFIECSIIGFIYSPKLDVVLVFRHDSGISKGSIHTYNKDPKKESFQTRPTKAHKLATSQVHSSSFRRREAEASGSIIAYIYIPTYALTSDKSTYRVQMGSYVAEMERVKSGLRYDAIIRNCNLVHGYQNSSSNIDLVFKLSLLVENCKNERAFVTMSRHVGPEHAAKVKAYAYAVIDEFFLPYPPVIKRSGMFPKYKKSNHRVQVERKFFMICTVQDPIIFWDVLIQCVQCTHEIYLQMHYLHQDISIYNLGYYVDEQTGKYIGVIHDFDLENTQESSTHVRTGTPPFMALEVLAPDTAYMHTFQHELESVLCIAIWHALGYVGSTPPLDDVLRDWRKGSWENIK